jgi:general secretion pathway protein D/type IV pilus assembly protein PilQ
MKRLATLLLILVLGGLLTAQAQPSALPATDRFDSPVELRTDFEGQELSALVEALARSIGLTAIVKDVPDTRVIYDIGDPKPFRQVWEIVLTLNELDYLLLENDLVVVAPEGDLAKLRSLDAATLAAELEDTAADADASQEFYRVHSDPESISVIVQRTVSGAHVEVLPGTSTLLVRGTPEQHEQVRSILNRFDLASDPEVIELRTYGLSNARATVLAAVLRQTQDVLVRPSGTSAEAADDAAPASQGSTAGTFTVTADDRTNTLIVAASPAVQDRVAALLPTLDVAQPQVNVQVRIQEIQSRTAADLGINLAAGIGQLSANILDGGLRFVFDSHAVVSAFNIGAVLDTLETQGLSRRVDDSSLTVRNNSQNSIQAGGTIFISIPGANENIERTIPYGVQIDVTPRIANDGRITLDISASVEDVLSETENPAFLELSTRAVNSVITLEPGQTVLLSGLLQNQFVQSRSQVPVLGSLPLIGNLFSTTTTEERDTELLIIVTADIIQ